MAVKKILVTEQAGDEVEPGLDAEAVQSPEPVEPVQAQDGQKDEYEPALDAAAPEPPIAPAVPPVPQSLTEKLSGGRPPKPARVSRIAGAATVLRDWLMRGALLVRLYLKLVAGAVVVVVVVLAALAIFNRPAANPLPEALRKEVNFTLYYPHSKVGNYKYITDSGSYTGGKLTYELGAGDAVIRISEQALTVKAPDLHGLKGFSVFKAPAGQAAVYSNEGVLNGVIVTDKTLIILNGLSGVSMQDFTKTINSLKA